MKSANVSEIKKELGTQSPKQLIDLCLRLSKFKKENKELLTYLLYEAVDEEFYVESIKAEMDGLFEEINTSSYYFINKTIRKILRLVKKHIRISQKKETEVELLVHFCIKMSEITPSIFKNTKLNGLHYRTVITIEKSLSTLHEDYQFDYRDKLIQLNENQ
jgi:hypothetical protein